MWMRKTYMQRKSTIRITVKLLKTKVKRKILKADRGEKTTMHAGNYNLIKIACDFSKVTVKARQEWNNSSKSCIEKKLSIQNFKSSKNMLQECIMPPESWKKKKGVKSKQKHFQIKWNSENFLPADLHYKKCETEFFRMGKKKMMPEGNPSL